MLTAKDAVIAEQREQINTMRALLTEILAADESAIASLTAAGYKPRPELYPFIGRISAIVRT